MFSTNEVALTQLMEAIHSGRQFSFTRHLSHIIDNWGLSDGLMNNSAFDADDYEYYENFNKCALCGNTMISEGYRFTRYVNRYGEFRMRNVNPDNEMVSANEISPAFRCPDKHCKLVREWFGIPSRGHAVDLDLPHIDFYGTPKEPYLSRRKKAASRNNKVLMCRFSDPHSETFDLLMADMLKQVAIDSNNPNKVRKK